MCACAHILFEITYKKHLKQSGMQQEHNKCLYSFFCLNSDPFLHLQEVTPLLNML